MSHTYTLPTLKTDCDRLQALLDAADDAATMLGALISAFEGTPLAEVGQPKAGERPGGAYLARTLLWQILTEYLREAGLMLPTEPPARLLNDLSPLIEEGNAPHFALRECGLHHEQQVPNWIVVCPSDIGDVIGDVIGPMSQRDADSVIRRLVDEVDAASDGGMPFKQQLKHPLHDEDPENPDYPYVKHGR